MIILNGCNSCQNDNFSSGNGLPALWFPNIQEVDTYIRENMKRHDIDYILALNNFYKSLLNTPVAREIEHNWNRGFFLSDLNRDGTYELYWNSSGGSGFIHFFIQGYDPVSNEYYSLNNRFAADYEFFIYKNNLYVHAATFPNKNNPTINNPIITNGELILEEKEERKRNEIMEWKQSQ
jgi:hypothetical protein